MSDKIFDLIKQEAKRQKEMIGLIPSENHISPEVSQVLSSVLSSKYSEGYPGRRYYEGNQIIDQIETLAQNRLKKLFGVPYVNVQPYSGSPANSAIEFALLEPGDTIMGLNLAGGGHLTHGHPNVTFSGKYFKSVQYGLDKNARIDFDQMLALAKKAKPKLIIAGTTAYPFVLDFKKFRQVADQVGAWLMADISHITGLVVTGEHPSPVPYCDVIMSTTHKTFRGPRGAMILVTKRGLKQDSELGHKIDMAIIPGLQGGPHNATTAGIAIAAREAMSPKFKSYGHWIVKNAQTLATALKDEGLKLVGDGTDNHLILIDLSPLGLGLGKQVAYAMDLAGIYSNFNSIPNEPCSPFYPSGVRIGTPLVTTRGMRGMQMKQIAKWIAQIIDHVKDYPLPEKKEERNEFIKKFRAKMNRDQYLVKVRKEVKELASKYPLFKW
ncbi:serine hydroxymethyltransferase [Candidatus Beckwithbacteria bacterium]|nr:serine hydroxymethyltransferase [Candidatus Beckwithbacteria bacterium]